ncbi:Rha family transcriptional regulator [Pantoea sp. SORGH_AS_0659]|uniref:Rha family transcriptional regulator n=1 Tax=Pantoea sp. SORGH_AS_0659 TaxID=3062597 RepID=UPI0028670D84|nr:Rha family transcriptional regulator [Pantoea sp. SORGH_AS_0659]MDR6350698.1 DNA-binding transcriptional MerR regulator [Pantoea sp. SORGH_AS_0659]
MAASISIYIPKAKVTPKEFSELQGVKVRTVYSWCEKGILSKDKKDHKNGRTSIHYLKFIERQTRQALGHNRFQIIVGREPF